MRSKKRRRPSSGRKPRRAPIENLKPNPRNPRKNFTDDELEELASSIRERGIIQPIVVRATHGAPDTFEIIAGERRWRAGQRAGLHDVPITVVEATDAQALEFAIIENVQREDLNPMEEATGYQALIDEFNHSQDEVAQIVGKSRPHVTNTLRLLKLSDPVQTLVRAGQLSAGHARLLVGQPNALALAEEIVKRNLNVRQVEAWMRKDGAGAGARRAQRSQGPYQRREGRQHARARAANCRTCSVSKSRCITAARAACCISTTRISISSTRCCGSWVGCEAVAGGAGSGQDWHQCVTKGAGHGTDSQDRDSLADLYLSSGSSFQSARARRPTPKAASSATSGRRNTRIAAGSLTENTQAQRQ